MSARSEYIAGLRQLADLLEQHEDELPLPVNGRLSPIGFQFLLGDDPKGALAAAVRAIPVRLDKHAPDTSYHDTYYDLEGWLHGLRISLTAYRDAVCERVVVSADTVVIPAKPAQPAEPERTVIVEQVEWVCHPVLADTEAGAV